MDRTRPAYDEMYAEDARVRPHYAAYSDWLVRQPDDALRQKRAEADSLFHAWASRLRSTASRKATSG